ncbi:EamA family transporter [Patescibacteria group bacterium]|nr:EamA family transporter [Patescibacteria group bacterium]MDQ5919862.1 bacterial/archaeal transporter family protein [Patescibacteria group bacterium]
MWILYGLLAALTAALMTIAAKYGLKGVDPTLATTLRAGIMFFLLLAASLGTGTFAKLSSVDSKSLRWIVVAAVFGALSWLFYFLGLQQTSATKLAALDRLSLAGIVILSVLFLGETLTPRMIAGTVVSIVGILLLTVK